MLEAIEFNDKSVIFATQNALNKAGFNCGMADGVAGTNTINAITQYQVDRGLEPTGQIDKESAVYFNNISIESGDPSINQMAEENVFSEKTTLDGISTVSFGLNNVGSYVDSCTLQDDEHYNPMLTDEILDSCNVITEK